MFVVFVYYWFWCQWIGRFWMNCVSLCMQKCVMLVVLWLCVLVLVGISSSCVFGIFFSVVCMMLVLGGLCLLLVELMVSIGILIFDRFGVVLQLVEEFYWQMKLLVFVVIGVVRCLLISLLVWVCVLVMVWQVSVLLLVVKMNMLLVRCSDGGWVVQLLLFQVGFCLIDFISMCCIIQLWLVILVGCEVIGIRLLVKLGQVLFQIQVCMLFMELLMIRCRCEMFMFLVSMWYCVSIMLLQLYCGKVVCRLFEGLVDLFMLMLFGMMMKYLLVFSGWLGLKSWLLKFLDSIVLVFWQVLCSISIVGLLCLFRVIQCRCRLFKVWLVWNWKCGVIQLFLIGLGGLVVCSGMVVSSSVVEVSNRWVVWCRFEVKVMRFFGLIIVKIICFFIFFLRVGMVQVRVCNNCKRMCCNLNFFEIELVYCYICFCKYFVFRQYV